MTSRVWNNWILICTILLVLGCGSQWASAKPQVPCYFIFGDSLVDNGNNNGLSTLAKVNFPPYGVDFPGGATGRFTNGRTPVDIIGELLGFDSYIPPFATARGRDILKGVNYASGGAGILDESGQKLGELISLNRQLQNHKITISRIAGLLKNKGSAKQYLRKCLYTVGMGSNDYLNNYLLPSLYNSSRLYTPDQYAHLLIQHYSQQLRALYNYGARKIAITGLGPLGCTPAMVALFPTNGSACVDRINAYVSLFNNRLKPLVDDFNNHLKDAKFTYINTTSISSGDPSLLGIRVLNAPCCNIARSLCIAGETPCSNRTQYVFWDGFHPSEISNVVTASRSYIALLPTDAYPFDIRHLAQL